MKKTLFIIAIIFCFIYFKPGVAFAQETISDFTSDITIFKDASVNIKESISYDFGSTQRRGIIREIPVINKNIEGASFKINLRINSITDEFGKTYNYSLSENNNNEIIKIGEENKYLSGKHTYIIDYTVSGIITYFSDHDELYWNVTGDKWSVPIEKSISKIKLDYLQTLEIKAVCYTGSKSSQSQNCQVTYPTSNQVFVQSNSQLFSGEGLTVALSFPKNIVSVVEPEKISNLFDTTGGKILLVFIGLLLFFYYIVSPLIVIILWYRYGRDPKVKQAVRAWYDPPKDRSGQFLKPAVVGTLVDEHADEKDISATIVDLAIRGFYKIKEGQKGKVYTLEKTKDYKKEKLLNFEKELLNRFFTKGNSITTTELKTDFYQTSNTIKDSLYTLLVKEGYFPKNPKTVRNTYYIIGGIAFFTGNILLAVVCFIFGRAMPKKTLFGAQSNQVALGLKNFLTSQSRQIKFQAQNWYLFEKLLPYAIVFGVEKIWAQRFKDISVQPPNWYEGTYSGNFNTILFISNFSRATNSFASISSPPSSTTSSSGFSSGFSGGSSGGGFGGGGGSSW